MSDPSDTLAAQVDDLLPQTQCGRCGYAGCRPYADAVAAGLAAIDRCPPGGDATALALAALTGQRPMPADARRGDLEAFPLALIDESVCIGCTLCIQACPVDAIVGAAKLMHTVLADECTGCGLCLPPCPVDCIDLEASPRRWTARDAAAAKSRFVARTARLAARAAVRPGAVAAGVATASDGLAEATRRSARRARMAAALERARRRRPAP